MYIRENKCQNSFHFKVNVVFITKKAEKTFEDKPFQKTVYSKGAIRNKLIKNVLEIGFTDLKRKLYINSNCYALAQDRGRNQLAASKSI